MSLTITETLDANDAGTVIALATASEGKQPYSYDWEWIEQPQGVEIFEVDEQNVSLLTVNALGGEKTGSFRVLAMDALGQEATDTVTLDFLVPLLAIELSDSVIEEPLPATGQSATEIVATGQNGVEPYTYGFAWISRSTTDLGLVETVDGTVAVTTTESLSGTLVGTIRATVTDALAQTAYADIDVSIEVPPLTLSLLPSALVETIEDGTTGTTLLVADAQNGVPPYSYELEWIDPANAGITFDPVNDYSTYIAVAADLAAATYDGIVGATVTDSRGQIATDSSTVEITVAAPPPPELPEIYLTSTPYDNGWQSTLDLPAGYEYTEDLLISHNGLMGFQSTLSNAYDFDGGDPSANVSLVSKCNGNDAAVFGTRGGLTVYGDEKVAVGTLSANGQTTIQSGWAGGAGSSAMYSNQHFARNVYRGTDSARRVVGAVNSDRTASDQSTVTVPGVTSPNDDSLLICFVLCYGAGIGWWYEGGDEADDWTRPAGQLFGKNLMWKRVPAGATGNLSFTRKYSGTTYQAYKRQLWLMCIDSVV